MPDITHTSQTEFLPASGGLLRTLLDEMPLMIWISGPDRLCTFVNKAWLAFTGRTLVQERGYGWAEGIHPEDLQSCLEMYISAFRERRPFSMEYRLRGADGEYRWILDHRAPWFEPDGIFSGYIGGGVDVTDRKAAAAAAERTHHLHAQAIRDLYIIMSARELPLEQRIQKLLDLGCRRFGLPTGTLSHIVGDRCEIMAAQSPGKTVSQGAVLPLCATICSMTIRCQEPVAIEHVSVSGWPVRPGTGNFEPEAYLGARIIVADEVYGTLSFSRSDPYPGKFSPADKDFLQLMAEWVGQELARSQAEETLRESQEALRRRTGEIIHIQNVLLELAKSDMSDWEKVIRTITERGAKALDVERVSVWLFNADRSEILCADLYHLSAGIHRKGSRLRAADYPSYFRALESSTVVAADDARADARTREFAGTYLEPLGITSMMDAAVQRDGKVVGVVCHEHTGPKREWTVEEQNFAMSAAEFVSLALEARERKKAEDEAERTHEALRRSREELRRLAGRLLTAMEEERRHVSRELHDDLNQKLAVLTVEAEALERTPSVAQAGIQDSLRHLRARIAALSDDVRHLAYQLHPSILDHLGLPAALKSFVDEFGKRERIKVRLTLKGLRGSLPQSVALCLYRVTQEALRNVAKHAQATRAVVRLTGNRGEVCLSITDNGVGDPSNPTADRRHGLGRVSMEERVRLVNGTFTVSSQPGRGTTVTARIPLSAES